MRMKLAVLTAATIMMMGTCGVGIADDTQTQASYVIGYNLGYGYGIVNTQLNTNMVNQGIKDGLALAKPVYTQAQMAQAMAAFQQIVNGNVKKQLQEIASKNLENSKTYIEKKSKEPGVEKIQEGLYYKVVQQGTGPMPKPTDWVTLNYQGMLPNGTVFYDTFVSAKTEQFQLSQTLLGWQKAIQKMPVGSTWVVYIAPSLGYGLYGPWNIGPNQALTYKIQLVAALPPLGTK